MAPELVGSFTQQANQHADRLCSVVRTVGETLISLAVAMTAQAATMALGPMAAEPGEAMEFLGLGMKVGSNIAAGIAQPALANKMKGKAKKITKFNQGLPGFLVKLADGLKPVQWTSRGVTFSYNWFSTFQMFPFLYYMQAANLIQAARAEYGALDVEGGSGDGGWARMCSSFEGDFANRNAFNIEKLQTWIPGQFAFLRNRVHRFYKDIYEGHVPFHGGPSMMSFILAGNPWAGDNSFLSDLRDTEQWQ